MEALKNIIAIVAQISHHKNTTESNNNPLQL